MDGFNGFAVHIANHDITLCAVSRAPLAKLQGFKRRMGWSFPWASSLGSDFNYDFRAAYTEEQQRGGLEYNHRREEPVDTMPSCSTPDGPDTHADMCGTDVATYTRERPGMSAFMLEDGGVYHTYSTYARGLDGLWGGDQWLDRAPPSPEVFSANRNHARVKSPPTASRGREDPGPTQNLTRPPPVDAVSPG